MLVSQGTSALLKGSACVPLVDVMLQLRLS